VDLLWYVTAADGSPVRNTSFIPLSDTGLSKLPGKGYVRLDVAREWTLIRSLFASEHFEVQWLYASVAVEAMLLDYAVAQSEDAELVQRAQDVMLQPPESLPHDDHLHLRIACSPEASVQGCEGGGPHWSWLAPSPALAADDEGVELLELLAEGGD
jgi:penicillin-insensitive murein endopeptidase